ncbi:5411_t:CDS:10 [Acaulospora colombiana]|uniref:5411_t:CDS:1 n=1 Tax=Acaulospora colombiana TaxID=27376 RepID=A0ACA9MIU6_9GLOM|nr:5411_t:CDS:10 [Acaulospora colombiana]
MHWDIKLTHKTRYFCLELLERCSEEKVRLTILKTLTFLSRRAPIDRSDQIDLLIKYIINSTQEHVRIIALIDIMKLAHGNAIFETSQALKLINLANSTPEHTVKIKILRILTFLVKHGKLLVDLVSKGHDHDVKIGALHDIQNFMNMARSHSGEVTVVTVKFFVEIIIEAQRIKSTSYNSVGSEWDNITLTEKKSSLFIETYLDGLVTKIPKLILNIIRTLLDDSVTDSINQDMYKTTIKEYLKCIFSIGLSYGQIATYASTSIIELLHAYSKTKNDEIFAEVSKFLLMTSELRGTIIQTSNDSIMNILRLRELLQMPKSFVSIAKTVLKALPSGAVISEDFKEMFLQLIKDIGQYSDKYDEKKIRNNQWNIYLIGIEAGKSGCCNIMANIMQLFVTEVDVDASRYWLRALSNVGTAEEGRIANYIQNAMSNNGTLTAQTGQQFDIFDLIDVSIRHHSLCDAELNGFMSLADTCNQRFFARWFCQLRANFLCTMKLFLEELIKSTDDRSSLTVSMKSMHDELLRTANLHNFVTHSFFDIDEESLAILESYPF